MTDDNTAIAAEVSPCRTCRFWHREQEQYIYGFCRRWPPRARLSVNARKAHSYDAVEVSLLTSGDPEWPNTAADDGCGEHAERSAK